MSWFAAILLPQFPLQAALRLRSEAAAEPVAVVEGGTEKGRVLDVTDAAAAHGVWRGMVSTQAMARCPALRILPRVRAQEQAMTALLIETAFAFSSFVEATDAGLCVLDLRQVKAGDWERWARGIVQRCAAVDLRARVGLAPNPDLAVLAAKRAEPALVVQHPGAFLADLAITEIDAPPELIAVLRDWGISHLGELAHLPRQEVAERLGPAAGDLWDRAAGRAHRELRLVKAAETFHEAFHFEHPIDTTEPLLFILRRQLEQLTLRLREAYRVAARMTLTIPLENSAAIHERIFTIPSPTADLEVLFRILQTHLESLRLAEQPNGVRLLIEPVVGEAAQHHLFESALRDPNRFAETLGRLAALVGEGNVGVAEMEDTHRPDSFRLVPPQFEKLAQTVKPAAAESRAPGLPLRRFRPPFPAQVHLHRHLPAFVFSEKAHGEIADIAGPYRVSGSWWDRESWATEEWDIALTGGALYRISKHAGAWFVEGFYDAPVR